MASRSPRRRDLLLGGAGAVGLAALGGRRSAARSIAWTELGAAERSPSRGGAGTLSGSPNVDVHCHTFCSLDLPIVGFVAHFIPGLTELSRFVSRWPEIVVRAFVGAVARLPDAAAPSADAELAALAQIPLAPGPPVGPVTPLPPEALDLMLDELTKHLPFTVGPDKRKIIARYIGALYLVAHARSAIAASITRIFPSISLFTPALVDYDAWSDDRAPTPLWQQILVQERIARLSTVGRIGRAHARFHPFAAFDPRRQLEGPPGLGPKPGAAPAAPPRPSAASSALELVRYAVEAGGFLGVKLYPPVGFAPTDNVRLRADLPFANGLDVALESLYAYCAAAEVPILTHASAANEYALGLHRLVSPAHWRPVLERHPTLRLNLGHFGHDYGVANPAAPKETAEAWIYQAAGLMDRYPNVYADLSNSPLVYDRAYAERLVPLLADVMLRHPAVKHRLMYGSDWWLSGLDPDATLAVDRFRATLGGLLGPEGLADVMGRNALRFLGFLDDAGRPRVGLASRRLRAFYGGAPTPSWLPG